MRSRSAILLTLLLFRIFFIPVWYSCNVQHFSNPAGTFEHIRIHKRRTWLIEEGVTAETVTQEEQQRKIIPLFTLIDRLFQFFKVTTHKIVTPVSLSVSPLFLRHCVLRL